MRFVLVVVVAVLVSAGTGRARAQAPAPPSVPRVQLDEAVLSARERHRVDTEYGATLGVFVGAGTIGALGAFMISDGSLIGGTDGDRALAGTGLVLLGVGFLAVATALALLVVAIVHDLAWHEHRF